MTQVEPFSRRPRRTDADQRYGEPGSGYPQDGPGRPDAYDDPRQGDRGYDPRPAGRSENSPRPDSRGGNGGYDPRPSNRRGPAAPPSSPSTRSGSGGYDPRPAAAPGYPASKEGYDPRPNARSAGYDPRPSAPGVPPGDPGDRDGAGRASSRAARSEAARSEGSRQAAPLPVLGDEGDRRGSHATTYGQGFSWVVAWTIVGAFIPGLGLIAAGWRRLGSAILGVLVAGAVGIAFWALSGNILQRGVSFAVDPQRLLVLAVVAIVIGLLWALVILLTNSQLRRYATLDSGQKMFSWLVVAALLVGVGVPTYTVGDYALVQRELVTDLFKGDGDSDADDTKPNSEAADPWAGSERVNVLLIGSDAGATRKGIRPDTLILASIHTDTGNTVLYSLPRSLQRVPFKEGSPGAAAWPDGYYCPERGPGNECMINAIWRWAEDTPDSGYHKFKNPGLRATEDAVTGTLGLEIDSYAMLNLAGFADFIDALGGVRLNVYERLPIGGNSSNMVATGGWLEKGMNQKMNGRNALWFARSRWSTDDYDRMRRQRCVIAAVTKQANPVNVATNWPKIAKALQNNMQTGIPQEDLQAWVELATRVQGAKVNSLSFTNEAVGGSTVDPDFDLMREKVRKANAKSERAGQKKAATSTPSPSVSAGTGTDSGTGTGKKKKNAAPNEEKANDPDNAQDVTQVC